MDQEDLTDIRNRLRDMNVSQQDALDLCDEVERLLPFEALINRLAKKTCKCGLPILVPKKPK